MWYILKIKFHIGIAMIVMRHFSLPWLASHMYKQGSFPMTYFRERDYSLNWSAMAKDWGNQLYCRIYYSIVLYDCNTSWPTLAILKVQQVHPYLHGFLIGAHGIAAANTPASARTKRKNVLHYKNGEFRPILCSPSLCLLERPMGESE